MEGWRGGGVEGSEGPLICQMGVSGRYRLCKSAGCGEAEALSAFSRDGRGGCSLLCFTRCKWKVTLQSACVGHQHTLSLSLSERERERERELFVCFKTINRLRPLVFRSVCLFQLQIIKLLFGPSQMFASIPHRKWEFEKTILDGERRGIEDRNESAR